MDRNLVKDKLIEVAKEMIAMGPGFAQEAVVLKESAKRLGATGDNDLEQLILTCWNDLFYVDRTLSWGSDLNNPSHPWFHFSDKSAA